MRPVSLRGISLFLIAFFNMALSQSPATMPVNTWLKIPNSRMMDVAANSDAASIIAYSGAVLDTKRNRLVLWGGGHAACANNEIYAYDINSLKWSRLTDPTVNPEVSVDELWDGNPGSRHTYNGMAYIAHADRMLETGGSVWGSGSANTGILWSFDFAANTWSKRNPTGTTPGAGFECNASYDPETKKLWWGDDDLVYWRGHGAGLYSYDYDQDVWTKHTSDALTYLTSTIDTKRGLLVLVGQGVVFAYNIRSGTPVKQIWTTTGGDAYVASYSGAGLDYDSIADKIVGFNGDGFIYALNPDTKAWSVYTPSGTQPQPSGYGPRTWGRFRYVPAVNAFVVVSDANDAVYFYKLTAGTGTGIATGSPRMPSPGAVFRAWPNPFCASTRISASLEGKTAGMTLGICDISGKLIKSFSADGKTLASGIEWSPGALPAGIYLLKVKDVNKNYTVKLMYRK